MKIFISSTFQDLKEERERLHISLKKAGLESLGMEFFVAESKHSKDVCFREIDKADLILLIVTDNYGTVDAETSKSFTHLEFKRAKDGNKEILAFLQKKAQDENVKDFQKEIEESGITVDYFECLPYTPTQSLYKNSCFLRWIYHRMLKQLERR